MSAPSPPLAVTGIGIVSPLGVGLESVFRALERGEKGLTRIGDEGGDLRAGPVPVTGWAGRIPHFDVSPYMPAMRARRLDRGSRFAMGAAVQALRGAGLEGHEAIRDELGVVVGTSSAGSGPLTVCLEAIFGQSPEAAPPFEFPNTVANAPASHVSIELGLRGPNTTLAHSEAVIGQILLQTRLLLGEGRCRSVLAGAVDEWNPYYQLGYAQLGALRDTAGGGGGTLLAEGAAALIVERPEDAAARNASVLGRILGLGVGSAPGEPFRWIAEARTWQRVIEEALEDAGLPPAVGDEGIGSVFLAASGIDAMEAAEAEALHRVFAAPSRRARSATPLLATGVKGAVGERAVSGALSVAAAISARDRGRLPPYAGGALRAGDSSPDGVAEEARWREPVRLVEEVTRLPPGKTLVLLAGYGGNYAAVVIG